MKDATFSKNEWTYPLLLAIIVPLLTLVPIIHGYLTTSDGTVFMGITSNVVDSNTYFDYMNQAADGTFLFSNSYTSEEMKPLLIRPLYWCMGLFTLILPSIFVFHFFRILFSALFVIGAYYFISYFMKEKFTRRFAITALALSSGFGWYFLQLNTLFGTGIYSVDLVNPEAIPFLSMNSPPHFMLSNILILLIMFQFYKGVTTNKIKPFIIAGIAGFFMGFIHIYNMVPIYLITGTFLLITCLQEKKISKERIIQALIFYGLSLPSILYYYVVFTFDPVYSYWRAQNVLDTPVMYRLIGGLGALFILAVVWFVVTSKQKKFSSKEIFLSTWFIMTFIALYLPFSFQIRFLEGYYIPIALLGTAGFFMLIKKLRIKRKHTLLISSIFLLTMLPSNAYMYAHNFDHTTHTTSRYSVPQYLTDSELASLHWLKENTNPSEVILAEPKFSNYVPRVSGNKVYVGHWAQTIHYDEKLATSRAFLRGVTDTLPSVDYVVSTNENLLDSTLITYQNEDLTIFYTGSS